MDHSETISSQHPHHVTWHVEKRVRSSPMSKKIIIKRILGFSAKRKASWLVLSSPSSGRSSYFRRRFKKGYVTKYYLNYEHFFYARAKPPHEIDLFPFFRTQLVEPATGGSFVSFRFYGDAGCSLTTPLQHESPYTQCAREKQTRRHDWPWFRGNGVNVRLDRVKG